MPVTYLVLLPSYPYTVDSQLVTATCYNIKRTRIADVSITAFAEYLPAVCWWTHAMATERWNRERSSFHGASILDADTGGWTWHWSPFSSCLYGTMFVVLATLRSKRRLRKQTEYHGLLARPALRCRRRPAGIVFTDVTFLNVAPLIRQRVDGSQRGLLR